MFINNCEICKMDFTSSIEEYVCEMCILEEMPLSWEMQECEECYENVETLYQSVEGDSNSTWICESCKAKPYVSTNGE